jgi:hypothetical protein
VSNVINFKQKVRERNLRLLQEEYESLHAHVTLLCECGQKQGCIHACPNNDKDDDRGIYCTCCDDCTSECRFTLDDCTPVD